METHGHTDEMHASCLMIKFNCFPRRICVLDSVDYVVRVYLIIAPAVRELLPTNPPTTTTKQQRPNDVLFIFLCDSIRRRTFWCGNLLFLFCCFVIRMNCWTWKGESNFVVVVVVVVVAGREEEDLKGGGMMMGGVLSIFSRIYFKKKSLRLAVAARSAAGKSSRHSRFEMRCVCVRAEMIFTYIYYLVYIYF